MSYITFTSLLISLLVLPLTTSAAESAIPRSRLSFSPVDVQSHELSVNAFRESGDPDYTLAFTRAMAYAAEHPGTRLELLCDSASKVGTFFKITSGFSIPSQTTLEASSRTACFIDFAPASRSSAAAFIISLIGSDSVTLRNLTVHSYSGVPPKVGMILERNKTNGTAGHHLIENVTVEGRFSVAPVYSISSEENLWISNTFVARGGGAKTAFYTAGQDHYHVCQGADCQQGSVSNLSLWMVGGHLINAQLNGNGITDVLDATGVGDHSYISTYIGLPSEAPGTASGFVLEGPQKGQGTNSSVQVISARVENGAYMARFVNGSQTTSGTISRLVFRDNTYASGHASELFSAAEGVTIANSRFSNNSASGTTADTADFDRVINTTFDEDYQSISIRTFAQGDRFLGTTSVSIPEHGENASVSEFAPNTYYPDRAGAFKPSAGMLLRSAGNGNGSAWGPSLNIPNGCCGRVPYANPRTGDIFAENNQPYYYDGTAPRPWLLGGVSSYSALTGNTANRPQPVCTTGNRGQLWFVDGNSGVADHLYACRKTAADTYAWAVVF